MNLNARRYNQDGSLDPALVDWTPDDGAGGWETTTVQQGGETFIDLYTWDMFGRSPHIVRHRYDDQFALVASDYPLWPSTWLRPPEVVRGGSRTLTGYQRYDWDVGFGFARARLRFVDDDPGMLPVGAVCEAPGQCASGRCRASVCCDGCLLWKGGSYSQPTSTRATRGWRQAPSKSTRSLLYTVDLMRL